MQPDNTMPSGCIAQWQVQGTQFKTIMLPLPPTIAFPLQLLETMLNIPVTDDNRRNLLAHWCIGTPQLALVGGNLLGFSPAYGGFDTLDPADLSADDLPLAVFYWDGQTVGFVDNWSARRRIVAPDPVAASWSGVVSDRRTADGEARLLQFQDQAAELVDSGAAETVVAATTFPLLPPVGFLPINTQQVSDIATRLRTVADKFRSSPREGGMQSPLFAPNDLAVLRSLARQPQERLDAAASALEAKSPEPGFEKGRFFGTFGSLGGVIEWEIADFALRQSWENMPIFMVPPLVKNEPPRLTYYIVIQNVLAQGSITGPNIYVVFVKNQGWLAGTSLPFDVSH
jgi:hypothetical protein